MQAQCGPGQESPYRISSAYMNLLMKQNKIFFPGGKSLRQINARPQNTVDEGRGKFTAPIDILPLMHGCPQAFAQAKQRNHTAD